jgi:hypothetical protein
MGDQKCPAQVDSRQKEGKTKGHDPFNNNNNNKMSVPSKEDLWKGAEVKKLTDNQGWIVEITGLDSKMHTVYARAARTTDYTVSTHPTPSVREVVESVVDVAWKHIAKHILEDKDKDEILRLDLNHWNQGAFPPASQLLELGAVWLVNETSFLQQQLETNKKGHHHHRHTSTKKKRLTSEEDGDRKPDWNDYVLRVHYAPSR